MNAVNALIPADLNGNRASHEMAKLGSTPVRAARMNEAGQSISSQIHHNHPRRTQELEPPSPSEIRGRLSQVKCGCSVVEHLLAKPP